MFTHLNVFFTLVEEDCDFGWTYDAAGRKCYKVFTDRLSWSNALAACEAYNSSLASITSSAQQTFIASKCLVG